MEGLAKIPTFSGSTLKIIAIISMVIDHCAYFLMENGTLLYNAMRCVGRIAFPVFAFLIVEGFGYTHNRKRYFAQLLVFAVISEVPWYLLNGADGLSVFCYPAAGYLSQEFFRFVIAENFIFRGVEYCHILSRFRNYFIQNIRISCLFV